MTRTRQKTGAISPAGSAVRSRILGTWGVRFQTRCSWILEYERFGSWPVVSKTYFTALDTATNNDEATTSTCQATIEHYHTVTLFYNGSDDITVKSAINSTRHCI